MEEHNLLYDACKNMISACWASWRIISSIEQEDSKENDEDVFTIKEYRAKVEAELSKICEGILHLIASLRPPPQSPRYYISR